MRNVGKLDERIAIKSLSETRGDFGEPILSDNSPSYYYAQVITKQGEEVNANGKQVGYQKFDFRLRFATDIKINQKLTWDSRDFDIESITHQRRFDQTILHCREVI
jgi:head-tail adaptor|tara:strand:+ start:224 stop:541 length:318 start_codon:yes stop_codon:yes gene_type:complete